MQSNHIEIRFEPLEGYQNAVESGLWIDSERIGAGHWLDWQELFRSLEFDGNFEFFTCECGTAGCDGIFDATRVDRNSDGFVHWEIVLPLTYQEQKARGQTTHHLRFGFAEYRAAIHGAWEKGRALVEAGTRVEQAADWDTSREFTQLPQWLESLRHR